MKLPLISVIIPAHNAAIFLPDAIASLRAQRDLTFDILIIDDGSTDATPAVAATLGDDVRVIQTPKIGPGAARNRGIAAARGDYIALLDADDLFPPDSLTVRAERLALDATLMLTGGYIQMVTLLGADSTPAHDPTRIRNVPYLNVNLGAMLYRREVFERVGGFDERLFYSEDVDWHLRAQEANMRMAILRRVTLLYRRHAVNVTAQPTLAQIPLTTMGVLSRASERRGVPTTIDTLNRHFAACVDPLPDAPPPLISVIAYIGAANATHNDVSLDSVRGQVGMSDYLPLDLIVVGADADAVAARYEARAVAADSIDAAVGRNVGIAAARGDLIAFIDAGEVWLRDKLRRQIEFMRANPHVETVAGYADTDVPTAAPPLWDIPLGSLLARRAAFDQVGGFDPAYPLAHAADWFTRALDANLARALPAETVLRTPAPSPSERAAMQREIARIHFASIRRRQHEKKYSPS